MTYEDEYSQHDEYEEDASYGVSRSYQRPAVDKAIHASDTLLRRAIDIIATARTIPLSASPMINRDEIIEILEEAVNRLPDELRQARWMLKERAEFVAKTRREADEILATARAQAEQMVQRTEVVRAAEQRARQVREAADSDARRLRHETEDFLDQRLASFEILLDKVTKTVAAGRARLDVGPKQAAEPAPVDDDEPGRGFFDQDRSGF